MYTSPLMGATKPYYNNSYPQQEFEFKYRTPPPPPIPQSDPYTELINTLNNCSGAVRQSIISNPEYKEVELECDILIKQAMEELIIPQLLNKPQGRLVFEKLLGITKKLKDKYSIEESETLQRIMGDPVLQKRLEELKQQGTNQILQEDNKKAFQEDGNNS